MLVTIDRPLFKRVHKTVRVGKSISWNVAALFFPKGILFEADGKQHAVDKESRASRFPLSLQISLLFKEEARLVPHHDSAGQSGG
jgi:hypothetical protein